MYARSHVHCTYVNGRSHGPRRWRRRPVAPGRGRWRRRARQCGHGIDEKIQAELEVGLVVVLHERARQGERIGELPRVEPGQVSVQSVGRARAQPVQPGLVHHGPERVGDEGAHDAHRGHAVESGRPRGRERELERTKTGTRVELTHDHDVDAARVPARDLAEGPD